MFQAVLSSLTAPIWSLLGLQQQQNQHQQQRKKIHPSIRKQLQPVSKRATPYKPKIAPSSHSKQQRGASLYAEPADDEDKAYLEHLESIPVIVKNNKVNEVAIQTEVAFELPALAVDQVQQVAQQIVQSSPVQQANQQTFKSPKLTQKRQRDSFGSIERSKQKPRVSFRLDEDQIQLEALQQRIDGGRYGLFSDDDEERPRSLLRKIEQRNAKQLNRSRIQLLESIVKAPLVEQQMQVRPQVQPKRTMTLQKGPVISIEPLPAKSHDEYVFKEITHPISQGNAASNAVQTVKEVESTPKTVLNGTSFGADVASLEKPQFSFSFGDAATQSSVSQKPSNETLKPFTIGQQSTTDSDEPQKSLFGSSPQNGSVKEVKVEASQPFKFGVPSTSDSKLTSSESKPFSFGPADAKSEAADQVTKAFTFGAPSTNDEAAKPQQFSFSPSNQAASQVEQKVVKPQPFTFGPSTVASTDVNAHDSKKIEPFKFRSVQEQESTALVQPKAVSFKFGSTSDKPAEAIDDNRGESSTAKASAKEKLDDIAIVAPFKFGQTLSQQSNSAQFTFNTGTSGKAAEDAQKVQPTPFKFGSDSSTQPTDTSNSSIVNSSVTATSQPFKFGSNVDATANSSPPVLFGVKSGVDSKPSEQSAPSISFGSSVVQKTDPVSSAQFGQQIIPSVAPTLENEDSMMSLDDAQGQGAPPVPVSTPAFSFGQPASSSQATPSFSFGSNNSQAVTAQPFGFGGTAATSFGFGQQNGQSAPSFQFNSSNVSQPAAPTNGSFQFQTSGQDQAAQGSFSFSGQSFGASSQPTYNTNPQFQFSSAPQFNSQNNVTPSFSVGASAGGEQRKKAVARPRRGGRR